MHKKYSAAFLTLGLLFSLAAAPTFADVGTDKGEAYAKGIIIKYKTADASRAPSFVPEAALRSGDQQALAAALSQHTGLDFAHHLRIATGADVYNLDDWHTETQLDALAAQLVSDPLVEYAETDRWVQSQGFYNDPFYPAQWHYFSQFQFVGGLNLPLAWSLGYRGTGVVVAVIDSGYLPDTDLLANVLPGHDMISDAFNANDGGGRDNDPFDPGNWVASGECGPNASVRDSTWHGTHVAGTVAAVTDNAIGGAGVAPLAKVVPVRALGKCGGSFSDIADSIIWAAGGSVPGVPANANPAKVLNLSLGGNSPCPSTYQAAIDSARANGATVIVAAGNNNEDAGLAAPANCAGVVTIAATNIIGAKAYYSNFGSVVDLAAPGGESFGDTVTGFGGVLSILNTGTTFPQTTYYGYYEGTSMAAPHVAGLAALMYQGAPNMLPDQVESILKNTARAFPGFCFQCGAGIADAAAAVQALPPPNDNFAHATPISLGSHSALPLENAFNDGSSSVGLPDQPDVWFTYNAPGAGTLGVSTCGTQNLSGLDTTLSLHQETGATGTTGNELAANDDWQGSGGDPGAECPGNLDSAVALQVGAGDALLIRVSRYSASFDERFNLNLSFEMGTDTDGDGVADASDNCSLLANPAQRDTDADGIGNRCDPDVALPNDCLVNFLDLNAYKANFFASGDADTDNNGDGLTNFLDLNIAKEFFFGPPGPSATGCN